MFYPMKANCNKHKKISLFHIYIQNLYLILKFKRIDEMMTTTSETR